jgi:hypothetical protein
MPTLQALDAVIRLVAPTTPVDASCQVLVTIDSRTGQLPRGSFWSAGGQEYYRYFLVTNSRSAAAVARRSGLRVGIEDFTRGLAFELVIDYESRCAPGREIRVAQALWNGTGPQERLEGLLRNWVAERLASHATDFLREIGSASRALAEELRVRAFEQTGLTLEIRIRLVDAEPDRLPFGPLVVRAGVCDCDEEVEIELEGELEVAPGEELIAFARRNQDAALIDSLVIETSRHFATKVTLQQYQFDLAGGVQQQLRHRLYEFLEGSGRRISRLKLSGDSLSDVVESRLVEHEFLHRPQDYPETVRVQTAALLQLADLGAYVRAHAPDLAAWTEREVERAVIESLFGETYTNLCLHYEEKKAEIERRMRERATMIGYELKQLVTITNLQLEILRHPFSIRVEDEFATKLAELKVGLEVEASILLSHPGEVAALLDRRVEVRAYISDALRNRLRETFHHVDPERFYMRFESDEGGCSVRSQLEAVIRETLESKFQARVVALSCKQLPTELSRRLTRLMQPLHEFEVVIEARGGPPICFDGSFRVSGVDPQGWEQFKTTNPEPEMLCKAVIRHLQHLLADHAAKSLMDMLNVEGKKGVTWLAQERVRNEFGLLIQIMDWSRRRLPDEMKRIEQVAALGDREIASLTETLDRQRDQLRNLEKRLRLGSAPQDEASLRRQIAELKVEQKTTIKEAQRELARGISSRCLPTKGLVKELDEGKPDGSHATPASAVEEPAKHTPDEPQLRSGDQHQDEQ